MNTYDENWNLLDPSSIDLENGYLVDTTRKILVKPSYNTFRMLDKKRQLKQYYEIPPEYEDEECRQYFKYTDSEKISRYKEELAKTDYIVIKMIEAQVQQKDISSLQNKYQEIIKKREFWRSEINRLELLED